MSASRPPISVSGQQSALAVIDAYPGESIWQAAGRAIPTALDHGCAVRFEFNGDTVICTSGDSPKAVGDLYLQTLADRAAAFDASPEGQARAERERQEQVARQADLNQLLKGLPATVDQGLAATLAWLEEFTPLADRGGLTYDTALVIAQLERIAPENAHVGRRDLKKHPQASGEYIVGQAINGINRLGSPHPMVAEFVRRWRAL